MTSASKHFLIVDENRLLLKALQMAIGQEGHSACTARTSREVTACIQQHHPDVVVLDPFMPEVDGFETMRVIKQKFPEARTIVLSGPALSENRDYPEMIELGADAVLKEPFTPQMLIDLALGQTGSNGKFKTSG